MATPEFCLRGPFGSDVPTATAWLREMAAWPGICEQLHLPAGTPLRLDLVGTPNDSSTLTVEVIAWAGESWQARRRADLTADDYDAALAAAVADGLDIVVSLRLGSGAPTYHTDRRATIAVGCTGRRGTIIRGFGDES